jgi:hypothetical protein
LKSFDEQGLSLAIGDWMDEKISAMETKISNVASRQKIQNSVQFHLVLTRDGMALLQTESIFPVNSY